MLSNTIQKIRKNSPLKSTLQNTPIVSALRLKQENFMFNISYGKRIKPCLIIGKKNFNFFSLPWAVFFFYIELITFCLIIDTLFVTWYCLSRLLKYHVKHTKTWCPFVCYIYTAGTTWNKAKLSPCPSWVLVCIIFFLEDPVYHAILCCPSSWFQHLLCDWMSEWNEHLCAHVVLCHAEPYKARRFSKREFPVQFGTGHLHLKT